MSQENRQLPEVTDADVAEYESLLAEMEAVDPLRHSEVMEAGERWLDWIVSYRFVERLLADRKRDRERIMELEQEERRLHEKIERAIHSAIHMERHLDSIAKEREEAREALRVAQSRIAGLERERDEVQRILREMREAQLEQP